MRVALAALLALCLPLTAPLAAPTAGAGRLSLDDLRRLHVLPPAPPAKARPMGAAGVAHQVRVARAFWTCDLSVIPPKNKQVR